MIIFLSRSKLRFFNFHLNTCFWKSQPRSHLIKTFFKKKHILLLFIINLTSRVCSLSYSHVSLKVSAYHLYLSNVNYTQTSFSFYEGWAFKWRTSLYHFQKFGRTCPKLYSNVGLMITSNFVLLYSYHFNAQVDVTKILIEAQ